MKNNRDNELIKSSPETYPGFLSLMFEKGSVESGAITPRSDNWIEIEAGVEESRLELFEKGLGQELNPGDTLEEAIGKMVKVALAAEFGPGLVREKGARTMVTTIARGILGDHVLRKQALLIIDRFITKDKKQI